MICGHSERAAAYNVGDVWINVGVTEYGRDLKAQFFNLEQP